MALSSQANQQTQNHSIEETIENAGLITKPPRKKDNTGRDIGLYCPFSIG